MRFLRIALFVVIDLILLCGVAVAQDVSVRYQSQALSNRGLPLANQNVAVCTQPAVTTTQPCSPLATLATSTSTSSGGANPTTTDVNGNYFFYAAPGKYTVQIYGPLVQTPFVQPDINLNVTSPFSLNQTFCRFENVRIVDPTNVCGWGGSTWDAWVMAAIADLPSISEGGTSYKQGVIALAPSNSGSFATVTAASTISVTSPFVSIIGPGSTQLYINCTANADCFSVRPATPFSNQRGSKIGGFAILGPGSGSANANGIHFGDASEMRFEDIIISNFTGASAAGFWIDNQNGYSERNMFSRISFGNADASGGINNPGNTKNFKFTNSTNSSSSQSFGYNNFSGIRMTILGSGQIGWSFEGSNPIQPYNMYIEGSANQAAGTTLFSLTGTSFTGATGNYINFRTESSGAATGWNVVSGVQFNYSGPGIVENVMDGSNVTDTISSSSFFNFISPTNRRSVGFGIPGSIGSYAIPFNATSIWTGLGLNMYWGADANWHTVGDGVHNGGAMIVGNNGNSPNVPFLFNCPDIGGTGQTITPANLSTTCTQSTLGRRIAGGTATMTTTAIGTLVCGTTVTVSATGVQSTDTITWSFDGADPGNTGVLNVVQWPTANNVNFKYCNPTAGSVTPAAETLSWTVFR